MSADFLIAQGLSGLASASSLFLVAAGLSIIFGVTRIVNFAHGALFMIGAYLAWTLAVPCGLGFWAAVVLAPLVVAALGAVMEMTLIRRIAGAPELFQIVATFAVALIVKDLVPLIWGPDELLGPQAPGLMGAVTIGGLRVPKYDVFLIVIGPLVLALLWLAFTRTRWGLLARAATEDRTMVAALGWDQRRLFTGAFALGSLLAGLGGALLLPRETIHHDLDMQMIATAFVVVVVGGMGSLPGAYLAALCLGLANAYGIALAPQATMLTMGLVMMAILALRPQGLLGRPAPPGAPHATGVTTPFRRASTRGRLAWIAVVFGLALAPLFLGDYGLSVLTEVLILALSAAALHLILAPGGLISFGHAAFVGLGAYGAALGVVHLGAPLPLSLLLGVLAGAAGACLVGWFVTRMSGVYLAMLTLAFAEIFHALVFQGGSLTGGDNGLIGVWPPDWAASSEAFYWLTFVLVAPTLVALRSLVLGDFGKRLQMARDAPERAAASGLNVHRVQWTAFAIMGATTGLAGGLMAFPKGSVFPTMATVPASVEALVMVLLGGVGSLSGPLIGAGVYTLLKTALSSGTDFWRLGVGVTLLTLALLFPGGLAGAALTLRRWRRRPAR